MWADFIEQTKNFKVSVNNYFYCLNKIKKILTHFNDLRRHILKKYVYTINHKRIAINYLYFSMVTGLVITLSGTTVVYLLPGVFFYKVINHFTLKIITALITFISFALGITSFIFSLMKFIN